MEKQSVTEEQRNKERELDRMVTMVANEWSRDKGGENLKTFILNMLTLYENRLHLDKHTIFQALEAKRTFSAMNYYQESRFGYLKEVEVLEKEKEDLQKFLQRGEEQHKEKLIQIAKKHAEALEIRTQGIQQATANWDVSLTVSCPYCKDPQDAVSADLKGSQFGRFEGHHTPF